MGWAVKFEGVSKRYRGGGPRYGSLRHDVAGGVRRLGGLFSGSEAPPQGRLALDNVSFEVEQGESFAIIGPNGAGKTTALKLISRISYPTAGRVRVRGRVGALIEVGSGVHPELTARENIWLYGQILGMSKVDVRRRFDEIVEFAELSEALDTPVKMYSSGMQLRLGFAIASHLDPEVFVVDEALAVGDASFQAKCVERMNGLISAGHTVLFVSHNLSAVEAVCSRGLFLLDGEVHCLGSVRDILHAYMSWVDDLQLDRKAEKGKVLGSGLLLEKVTLHDNVGNEGYSFGSGDPMEIRLHIMAQRSLLRTWFSTMIHDGRRGGVVLCSMLGAHPGLDLSVGRHVLCCRVDSLPLAPRVYDVYVCAHEEGQSVDLLNWTQVSAFRLQTDPAPLYANSIAVSWMAAPVRLSHSWCLD
jgi:lipopolysaccharide transport system ATP-binding protein